MKQRLFVLSALFILALPAISSAASLVSGPHASVFIGASFPKSTSVTSPELGPTARTFNDRAEFDPRINIGGTGERVIVYRSDDDTIFAYKVGADLQIALHYGFSPDLAYRYFGTGNADVTRNAFMVKEPGIESRSAVVGVGIRF